jgi:hypothetical protein
MTFAVICDDRVLVKLYRTEEPVFAVGWRNINGMV